MKALRGFRTPFVAALVALIAGAGFAPAEARLESRVVTERAESALYPVRQGFAPGETTWFVFEQHLKPGWHVYWKNPGDSGLPLELDWTLPDSYAVGEIIYPTPERIPVGPLANFGHHGNPAFLIPVTAPTDAPPGETVAIEIAATWLICEEICVPEEGAFTLSMPVAIEPATDERAAARAEAARADAPQPFDNEALFHIDAGRLTVAMKAPDHPYRETFFFPETERLIEPAAPQTVRAEDGRLMISMKADVGAQEAGDEIRGVLGLVLRDGTRAGFEIAAARTQAPLAAASPAAPAGGDGALVLLLTAFLGGALLNVMPCVFPVVFIKAASLMSAAAGARGQARRDGILYTAGVLTTFLALGGVLLALRAGGEALGWGFHLQSPAVVLLSAYVLFAIGLNLAGVFHVGESLQGAGAGLLSGSGGWSAFLTGALAVFVAAPCIGPLMAAPMGAAVLLPPAAGMAIFGAMALGLAAPYLLLSLAPELGRFLPRPGPWMVVFKQALAFPVFAGAAYFLWVLSRQTGAEGLAWALAGAVMLAFAAWLYERAKSVGAGARLACRGFALAALVAAFAPLARGLDSVAAGERPETGPGGTETIAFDPEKVAALRAEGRPVFLDFTAAWCVTCQFDHLTVLSRRSVKNAFAKQNVAFMVADWTRRDPVVTQALQSFGASGVPLYVYYPPGGEAIVLPSPLTEKAVLDAVRAGS
ncbi:protein-disulfide reductase DsbD family protein [Amphiplicatus metriothermophilus]|uniref:Thiol:disulfide interchange protein DsbD n=1 Tax=Amphiplicatus metriothermophilus TaxID=1519374 RepID=A0A239PKR3_9PROT|nr:protein-disulfide reductase DsbD domain-containing protein [Amphiplicatus metriothermophilus]MBB5518022.1 thiol:disulfide interchange protein DsbD [Amphiplicatus metriothermophilus]SNT67644.1 thiol:disulfide interchange protein DsbD [Amphiplicatus metriothermophilus]